MRLDLDSTEMAILVGCLISRLHSGEPPVAEVPGLEVEIQRLLDKTEDALLRETGQP